MSDSPIGQTVHAPVFVPVGYGSAPFARSAENPAVPLSQIFDEDIFDGFAGPKTTSGVRVTRKKALGISAVWRAVCLISGKIAVMPMKVFKSVGQGKEVDKKHPAYRLLKRSPNDFMTPYTLKETLQSHALLRGNGYAYVFRDADANPIEILPLNPEVTWPVRAGGKLWYITEVADEYAEGGGNRERRRLRAEDVIHIRGMGFDGLVGYDVVTILRETLGKAIATREHGTRYFSNDARPSMALEFPAGMKSEAVDNVVSRWNRMNQGLENKHKVGMLREGVKIQTFSSNARESQLTENLNFDAVDVANVFGLPPRKVGLDQGGGYNSLFEENQSVHDDTLDPWRVRWEEECDQKLLTEQEQETESHSCLFVRNSLMRSNPDQRAAFYDKMVRMGAYNLDQVLAFEDQNPIPGGMGQLHWMQAGMTPLGQAASGDTKPNPDEPDESPADQPALANSLRNLLAETAGRMARRLASKFGGDKDPAEQLPAVTEAMESVLSVIRAARRRNGPESAEIASKMLVLLRENPGAESENVEKCVEMVLKTVFPEA